MQSVNWAAKAKEMREKSSATDSESSDDSSDDSSDEELEPFKDPFDTENVCSFTIFL